VGVEQALGYPFLGRDQWQAFAMHVG